MTSPETSELRLQFDAAEPAAATPTAPTCVACKAAIVGSYHTVNGNLLCTACRQRLEAGWVGGQRSTRIAKALLLGTAGAVAGAGVYYAVLALTGYEIGLIAIVVGYLVGRGVRTGSGGRGGPGYQAMAMGLTYVAIVSTYVPMIMSHSAGETPPIAAAIIAAIAMPFLLGTKNLIGLLILGFAVYQAWAMNKRASLVFAGPFEVKSTAA
jgi:hypothetical protein